jgi:hypothetical protein
VSQAASNNRESDFCESQLEVDHPSAGCLIEIDGKHIFTPTKTRRLQVGVFIYDHIDVTEPQIVTAAEPMHSLNATLQGILFTLIGIFWWFLMTSGRSTFRVMI